jgi:hypothetical protein
MSRKYKFGDSGELYFISFTVINWVDSTRDFYGKKGLTE